MACLEADQRELNGSLALPATSLSVPPPLPPALPRARVTGDHRQAEWRLALIQPIRQTTAPGTTDRANAIAALAATPVLDWRGRWVSVADRTIREWISRYEAAGFAGLMRKAPSNAGQARVHLSREWDRVMRAAGLSEDDIAGLVAQVRKRVRGEWASATPSWPTVQRNTLPLVAGLTRRAGVQLPDREMHRVCQVPRRFVEAERRYAIVAVYRKDAARFAAEFTPRIRRDRSHLQPAEWVAADVHHGDILFRCADGREVTPKVVAWMDLATNRARLDVFIMPPGEMIRREHVLRSFVAMCKDPDWGVPSRLYADNGGEYNWAELTGDLLKLKHSVELRGSADFSRDLVAEAEPGLHRARAYNPQAKVIEGLFSNLERTSFSQLPGWIGGDRMRKKTANQGRAPEPFPGDEAQLRKAIATALAYYHAKPQSGHLRGISPDASFAGFVARGWSATVIDPWELAVAFSRQMVKQVYTGGALRLEGKVFRADALQSLVGRRVLVRQPLFGDRDTLFVFTEHGEPIATAIPEMTYRFGDVAGAGEQSRRAKVLARDVAALEAQAEPAKAGGERAMADVVALFGAAPRAGDPHATISLNPEYSTAAQMAKSAPAQRDEEITRKQADRAHSKALRARLAAGG